MIVITIICILLSMLAFLSSFGSSPAQYLFTSYFFRMMDSNCKISDNMIVLEKIQKNTISNETVHQPVKIFCFSKNLRCICLTQTEQML